MCIYAPDYLCPYDGEEDCFICEFNRYNLLNDFFVFELYGPLIDNESYTIKEITKN